MAPKAPQAAPQRTAVVIGAGFAGLAAACSLAKKGWKVVVLEKNDQLGGRCRTWEKDGFLFDMGPSWYWMPEVFEEFFAKFGKKVSDYYKLTKLDPPYKVFFKDEGESSKQCPRDPVTRMVLNRLLVATEVCVPDKMEKLEELFEGREAGAGLSLRSFLAQASYKYGIGMGDYVWRPSIAWVEFMDPRLLVESIRLQMFSSQRSHVQKHFKDPTLVSLMEWPVLFLGGGPADIPAMYSMMNHAAIVGGTWWPEGGMSQIPSAMVTLAKELGVEFRTGAAGTAKKIHVGSDGKSVAVEVEAGKDSPTYTDPTTGEKKAGYAVGAGDSVVAAADYHHVEQHLLDPAWRQYNEKYWDSRVLSPGSLLFYLGLNRTVPNLEHHNLFFDEDIDDHVEEIYGRETRWPKKPLFYVSVTSQSERQMAPKGCDAVFVLVPLAPGLDDDEASREECYNTVMTRLEKRTGVADGELRKAVVVKRMYAHKEFEEDYNSYKGNAYGLANTLFQTAILKPSIKPNKVTNLYFAGQLTSPGPGVPPSIISGQVVADLIEKEATAGTRSADFLPQAMFVALFAGLLLGYLFTAVTGVTYDELQGK